MRRETARGTGRCVVDFTGGGRVVLEDRGARITDLDVPGVTTDEPLLWTGPVPAGSLGVRGVVPIYPWFAGGRVRTKRPLHGVVADLTWALDTMTDTPDRQEIVWCLDDVPLATEENLDRLAAFSARARYTCAGRGAAGGGRAGVALDLQVRNGGTNVASQAVGVLAAIRVADPDACWVKGLDSHERSGLDGLATDTLTDGLRLDGPITALFEPPRHRLRRHVEVHDAVWDRTTILTGSAVRETFVWRPADYGHTDPFVVVGFVNVRRNLVRLVPGQTYEMAFGITARRGAEDPPPAA